MSFGDTIAQTVLGKPTVPEDTNNAPNVIAEGAAVNTSVGITAHSTFANGNAGLTYSLSADSSAGGFKIDPNTGVVTVADPSKIDFETSPGHVYSITVEATKNNNFSSEQTFTIAVTDVAPSTPVDSNAAANTVVEGAASGTAVGVTASSSDINGPAVTYSLTGDTSGGGFTINAATGVVTVADATKIDYESSGPGHSYTVVATASDGTLSSSQSITIAVTDVPLSTPVDTNAAANTVVEGAANGSTVGITAFAVDPNGPVTTYSLTGDSSLGGFTINAATGVVTVADATKLNYETAAGHAYTITVQANDGVQTTSQNFSIAVTDVAPSTPVDSNAAANTVVEGAANGSTVGVTASSTDVNGPAVTYSLVGDTSGGGFTINAVTGVVTVADATKIDYETAAGHAYTVTAQASDGTLTSSQAFTIAVTDVAPSIPVDSNAAGNSVVEGAANGSTVGITASSTDINGPAVTYSLVGDTSGGGFTINAATGVVTVADSTKIDYESSPGHAYTVTAQASDGTLSSSQTFTVAVTDAAPSVPVDSNAAANTVAEGAANGSTVGVTASSTDVNGPAVTYSLVGDTSGGGFTINAATGVVTVADATKIDYESSPGHAYTVTAQASDGTLTSSQTFTIAVTDVAPSTPVDANAGANTVVEGAANGSTVGVTASSTDVNGPAVTYSLVGDTSGGGFTINAATGVVTVADATKIDYETAAGHAYTVTAQASDGTLSSSQTFTIAVTDVAPSTPVDSNVAANTVAEGAANGSTVGITASSTDINGPAVTYSLVGDTSGGGFTINAATGVVTVADATKIDYETAAGHAYTVTAQASDGTLSSSQTFTIAVTDVAPSTPIDSNGGANTVAEGAANGSTVGVTASSTDVNGPAVTYSLTGDTSGGGFTINSATGVVTVGDATKIDFESSGGSYTVTAQASDGTLTSSQAFVINVTDVAPSTPVDSDAATNQVSQGAPVGTHVGVTASSTDVNGPAVTYSLVGDTSGGGFTINAATGVVTVADPSKVVFTSNPTNFNVTVDSSDGTLHSQQTFTINVLQNTPPVANDDSVSATEAGGLNNAVPGVNPSGNVILGTGAAGDVQDTDAQDASNLLTVVAVHTGPEGGSILAGTVGSPLTGAHGTLTLNTDGSYTYLVNQSDAVVQALHTSAETITDVFNYTISDTGGLQDTATLTITIHGADDLPQAVADTGTMTEDDAPTSFNVIANDTQDPDHTATNAITVGPASITVTGPAGETMVNSDATASIVSNQVQVTLNNAHFQQLAAGEHATVTVPYTLTGDAGETSSANLVVTVNGVNDSPVANDDSVSATEKGGVNNSTGGVDPSGNVITGTGSAGAVADTDPDHGDTLTVFAVHTGPEGGSIAPGVVGSPLTGAHGTLTLNTDGSYTYLVNQTDTQVQALATSAETLTDTFNYTIRDTGGLQDTATLTVTIHGANDLPQAVADTGTMTEDSAATSFNVIANDTLDPDHTATNLITLGPGAISVSGPAGETMVNADATAAIVSNQVQVTLNNAHFQQLALGEHATVTVPYTLTGDAGDTSTANLVVTVNGVNDVPVAVDDSGTITEDQVGTFTVLGNDTLDADHGAPNNVTAGTVGNLVAPGGEGITTADIGVSVNVSNQIVVTLGANFQHMQDGQTATFDIPYTLHGDQAGDVSSATLHVTVNGVNDAPTANSVTFSGVDSANYNTDLVVNDPTDGAPTTTGPFKGFTASLLSLSNAADVDGPNALTFTPLNNVATTDGGHVTLQADGDFIYTPKVGTAATSDSFSFTVTDGNTGVSGPGTHTATATIDLQGPHIWYVNADASSGGDGSSEHPFNSLAPLNGVGNNGATTGDVDSAGDIIYLENSTAHLSGGITLENNEQLISQGQGLIVPDGGGVGGTVTLQAASGTNVIIDGAVVLAQGNTISGVDIGSGAGFAGFALSGSSVGTSTFSHGSINNAGGGGVSIGGSSNVLNMDFASLASGGGTNGISLTNSSGTFHAHSGGTISGASGADVALNGGTVNFTDDGAISDASGLAVSVASMTGGTQSFTGAIGGAQIALTTNTNATMDFSGGVTLSAGTSNAFVATGGGTVNVTGTNHLTTTTGTALDIANTTIGSSNVTFHDINSNGAVHGIVLNTTGSSGGLVVTGDGGASSNHSGGQILSSTGDGVSLNSTSNVSLSYLDVNNGSADGIHGDSVNNLTLNHDNVLNTGTNTTTSEGLKLGESSGNTVGVTGAVSITNSSISGSGLNNVHIRDTSGTISSLTVTGDTFNNVGLGEANSFLFEGSGTSALTSATFTGNTLANNGDTAGNGGQGLAHALTVQAHDTATIGTFTASGNTFTNNGVQADFDQDGSANLTFRFLNNGTAGTPMTGSDIQAINVFTSSNSTGGTLVGTIQGNHIGTSTLDSGSVTGGGITALIQGHTDATLLIDSNVVQGYDSDHRGIDVEDRGPDSATGPVVTSDVTITGNTVTPGTSTSGFPSAAIFVGADNQSGSDATAQILRANIHGNTVPSSTVDGDFLPGQLQYFQFTGPGADGIGQLVGTAATASAQLAATNTGSTSASEPGDSPPAVGITVIPGPITTPPLFAASGGVQASSPTPGETNLTQAELDSVVAAAIGQWAAAGASAAQLAALHAVIFSVADLSGNDLSGNIIGQEDSPTHITIDNDAAGHGWFVDPTASDNSEFTHAQNAAGTDLLTDPASAAAGHLDLLTTVTHELGHVLGLPDSTATSDAHDLMYISLVDGERRLPDTADVAEANANLVQASEAALPVSAQPAGGAPIVVGTSGNDTIDAGLGGKILFGGAGADNFVFGPDIHLASATAPAAQPITHVADYSAAEGDTFDFSALTSAFHASMASDASLVRAVEDPSGTFATLQLNTAPDQPAAYGRSMTQAPPAAPNWVNVAQLDGAHSGDAVNVLLDSHLAVHLAQIHVGLLV